VAIRSFSESLPAKDPVRCLVVIGEVAQEEEGQHVVAEVFRIPGADRIGDAPEGIASCFWLVSVMTWWQEKLAPF
jgi:hypothetical protein